MKDSYGESEESIIISGTCAKQHKSWHTRI